MQEWEKIQTVTEENRALHSWNLWLSVLFFLCFLVAVYFYFEANKGVCK
jgi:hypothetical protein